MASSEEYLAYVMDLLSDADAITSRKMMGEYVLYCRGKVFGGVYDGRFLVKDVESARNMLPDAERQEPYDGAKPMLRVDTEDRQLLARLVDAMAAELPEPKRKKHKQS